MTQLSRRSFLAGTGTLVFGLTLPLPGCSFSKASGNPLSPNTFVTVAPDNTVTILSKHIEFGQGPFTGMATLIADEMDAAWDLVKVEHAPANAALYSNTAFGSQGTGGSTAMNTAFTQMRETGARMRAMLVEAAAKAWGVAPTDIKVAQSTLSSGSNKATFGEMAGAAAKLTPPEKVILKTPEQFIYIGKPGLRRVDSRSKADGSATFTLDVYKDNMLTAVLARPDILGATVAKFDASATRKIKGVADVKDIGSGVAVYATETFAALTGRKALDIAWDTKDAETRSTKTLTKLTLDTTQKRGKVYHTVGDIDKALAGASQTLEAQYSFPLLAHCPMEPLDAVIAPTQDGGLEVWMGSQIQTIDHATIADVTGISKEKIHLNTMLTGGSFGRRAQADGNFAAEAAQVFMAAGGKQPVKLMWTREDDLHGAFYRPLVAHKLRGGLDEKGNIIAWEQTIAGGSIVKDTAFSGMMKDGVDRTMIEGTKDLPYAIPNQMASAHIIDSPIKNLWWRSVGHTHTGYAIEAFMDELFAAAEKDPVEGRLAMMKGNARQMATLEKAAELSGWGKRNDRGRALGVATVKSFGSYVSQVAEVSMDQGQPKVHKVWCVVDCGIAVNPDIVKAQMEGGIGYGLSAVMYNALTLGEGGRVEQSNFDTYRSMRIGEMPDIEVHIMASTEHPSGVGEPGVPPIGPAVANAVRTLTGASIYHLPMIPSRA